MEVRRVERIDVGAEASADPLRERPPIRDRRNRFQRLADRLDPFGFDRRLVHVARVVVADAAFVGTGGRAACSRTLEEVASPLRCPLDQEVPYAGAAAVGRNLGALHPRTVREAEEVVARGDQTIHAGKVDIVRGGCLLRLTGLRAARRPSALPRDRERERRRDEGNRIETLHDALTF